ncbi:hypothetical protein EAH76_17505 [Sphingomonas glacialis]|uniref:Uncharacterized protein n=1 Tax=Sphingomonas glacialis TaxID=658225 RepID=A0A502FJN0_9SPHN|nr:hypothetical protein EAH76_17505 [Sphingomonas glacialis]
MRGALEISLSLWERSFGSAMPPAWPEQRGALFTRNWARSAQPSGKGEGSAPYWRVPPSPDLAALGHPLPKGEGM